MADNIVNIQKYRELFPRGILPNGQPARSDIKELEKKFEWFFITYPHYTWEIVLLATKNYVEHYSMQDYKFMQTSSYFISKQDKNRVKSSSLATWCQITEEDKLSEPENFDINV